MDRFFDFLISFKKKNNRKATQFWSHIFKLQQEVLKFNAICVNWRSPKSDLDAIFLA